MRCRYADRLYERVHRDNLQAPDRKVGASGEGPPRGCGKGMIFEQNESAEVSCKHRVE